MAKKIKNDQERLSAIEEILAELEAGLSSEMEVSADIVESLEKFKMEVQESLKPVELSSVLGTSSVPITPEVLKDVITQAAIDANIFDLLPIDKLPPGWFKQKNNSCPKDKHNAFYNNTAPGADEVKASFYIKNLGTCPVEISISEKREGPNDGDSLIVPVNNNDKQGERLPFDVPAGRFLRAKCTKKGTCKYIIGEVRP